MNERRISTVAAAVAMPNLTNKQTTTDSIVAWTGAAKPRPGHHHAGAPSEKTGCRTECPAQQHRGGSGTAVSLAVAHGLPRDTLGTIWRRRRRIEGFAGEHSRNAGVHGWISAEQSEATAGCHDGLGVVVIENCQKSVSQQQQQQAQETQPTRLGSPHQISQTD